MIASRTEQHLSPGAGAEWGSEAFRAWRFRPRGAPGCSALNMATDYTDGEEVIRVRVAATLNGPSLVTYLTASGREIVMR